MDRVFYLLLLLMVTACGAQSLSYCECERVIDSGDVDHIEECLDMRAAIYKTQRELPKSKRQAFIDSVSALNCKD